MSNNTTIPSLEEFTELIIEALAPRIEAARKAHNGISAEEYVANEAEYIEKNYKLFCDEFKTGKITANVFRIGCVDTIVNCLDLSYEGK